MVFCFAFCKERCLGRGANCHGKGSARAAGVGRRSWLSPRGDGVVLGLRRCDGARGAGPKAVAFRSGLALGGFASVLNELDVCWPASTAHGEAWSRTAGEKNCLARLEAR